MNSLSIKLVVLFLLSMF